MRSKVLVIIGIITLLFVLYFVSLLPLNQEDNTADVIYGISRLNLSSINIFEYDSDDIYSYYITRSHDAGETLSTMLVEDGYRFLEQMGAAYIYIKYDTEEQMIVESKKYTSGYTIFYVPKKNE